MINGLWNKLIPADDIAFHCILQLYITVQYIYICRMATFVLKSLRQIFFRYGNSVASSVISLSTTFKVSSEIAQESWQVKWDQEPAGFFTRLLIPEVNTRILLPRNRDAGISYCRLLLHDTMLREDSFRTGISDTPMCKCGMEHESVEHFLFRCAEHHSARSIMIDDINMILSNSKCKSVPTLSEQYCSWHRTGTVISVRRKTLLSNVLCSSFWIVSNASCDVTLFIALR